MIDALTSGATLATPIAATEVRSLGRVDYEPTWRAMQSYTATRRSDSPDEIWILEHPPVYTVGIAGRAAHLPRTDTGITVVHTDRGGQITYHGPGQIVAYLLLDLRRRGWGVRTLVRRMEHAVIDLLAGYGIAARGSEDAPGVYVGAAKIAALGLRIRNGCCYHGIALNVDMDLQPFRAIDPCGYPGLAVTQLRELGVLLDMDNVAGEFSRYLLETLQ
jgi:lipoyl(octanoyl) transferase